MPFDPAFDGIYDSVIRPVLSDAGYEVSRADSVVDQQNVLRDIVRGIAAADLIVADLTGRNANVFYELGIAHALGVPTVLITQSIEEIPFDLRAYRVHEYSERFDAIDVLRERLGDIATAHSEANLAFGNPVSDFLSENRRRGLTERRISMSNGADHPSSSVERYDAALGAVGNALTAYAEGKDAFSPKLDALAERLDRVAELEGTAAVAEREEIEDLYAAELVNRARETEELLSTFAPAIDELTSSALAYVETLDPDAEDDQARLENILKFMQALRDNAVTAIRSQVEALETVRTSLEGDLPLGVIRASERYRKAEDAFTTQLENLQSCGIRVVAVASQKFERLENGERTTAREAEAEAEETAPESP